MPIKPLELLDHAKQLASASNEADYRSAASRAYYFCYHYSRDMSESLDDAGGKGTHEKHINMFTHAANRATKSIGYMMRDCYTWRITADYMLDAKFGAEQAQMAIKMAEKIREAIDKFS